MEIILENAVARFPEFRFREPLSWNMAEGENWAVTGPNGAGKSLFMDTVRGAVALKEGRVRCLGRNGKEVRGGIRTLVFQDIYSMPGAMPSYYQQRWNSQDSADSPHVSDLLDGGPGALSMEDMELFGIRELLGKKVLSLSSGELRKLMIARALMSGPSVLVLDNPFIGLDEDSRRVLDNMLSSMSRKKGLQVILVLGRHEDIPAWIDKVQPVLDRRLLPPVTRGVFFSGGYVERLFGPASGTIQHVGRLPWNGPAPAEDYRNVLEMRNVTVKYKEKTILSGLDWSVGKGECWALLGKNGSGKSTLLSLVCGDNPQAYANDIVLFGRRRGTGESIWDIKRRIGYLSPDVHTCYMEDIPCREVVESGFFDSVGLFRECTPEQRARALAWMEIFGAESLAGRSFVKVSYGEQRLVLLARAFVKSPELLVLDEPLHGLDSGRKALALEIIDKYCADPRVSLLYVTHYRDEIPSCVTRARTL